MIKNTSQSDVLLISASKDEFDVVLEAESDWQFQKNSRGFVCHTREIGEHAGNKFSITVAHPTDEKGCFAPELVSLMVNEFKPRCISTVGVCAGEADNVSLGDVIIADRVFQYDAETLRDFQEGKVKGEDVFHHISDYHLSPLWSRKAEDFSSDWVNTIKCRRPMGIPSVSVQPKVHVVSMGAGNPEKEYPALFPGIGRYMQEVFATEMGTASVGTIARVKNTDSCIIVKAVADQTNHKKKTPFYFYAIEASYRFLMAFLEDNLLLQPTGYYFPGITQTGDMLPTVSAAGI
ncbi:hypothetical protein QUF72_17475 [Desulfobacterales bacterium HSG2]|nr:hypothetical protein [Desulfobacterales bacterium HSG2]